MNAGSGSSKMPVSKADPELVLLLSPCTLDALMSYLETLTKRYPHAMGILLHQDTSGKGSFHSSLERDPELVALTIRPERGFSQRGAAQFIAEGWVKSLVLGTTVLRTKTATLYTAAAVRSILLEKEL